MIRIEWIGFDFWLWLCRFAFRRMKARRFGDRNVFGKIPCGVPTIRDPDHPCDAYRPMRNDATWECQGDGHYLCDECAHRRLWERNHPEVASFDRVA